MAPLVWTEFFSSDEYTRECLAAVVARRLGSQEVLLLLAELFCTMACRNTFGPTMGRSSSLGHCEAG